MKRIFTTIVAIVFFATLSFATKHIINTVGSNFSPFLTEAVLGDTIVFNIASGHTATQVSKANWDNNITTGNGGFDLSAGNNQQLLPVSAGNYYYICQFHGSMGMKGQITVSTPSRTSLYQTAVLSIFPNPVQNSLRWFYGGTDLKYLKLFNISGDVCKSWVIDGNTSSVPVEDFPAGMYFFAGYAESGRQIWIEKIQKL
jgi:plastocyanin